MRDPRDYGVNAEYPVPDFAFGEIVTLSCNAALQGPLITMAKRMIMLSAANFRFPPVVSIDANGP
ncbi:MAG: hypothetical protein ABJP79_13170 [Tateyamaria sp.]|uniref:hypothetical protein n=1 Tax=Tateyamaria sp. TaxID=1929288 RepID=UPI0032A0E31D